MSDVTQLIKNIEKGEADAAGQLLPVVYEELRRLASAKIANEPHGQTLQPTALVHEAYLRLVGSANGETWENRAHFFAAAAEAMRRILVENARRKKQLKNGGGRQRMPLEAVSLTGQTSPEQVVLIDEALNLLAQKDPKSATLVKLRFFVGMTLKEAADSMGVSEATAYRDWAYARAWLFRALGESQ